MLEFKGGQSVTGRLWDLLRVLHLACRRAVDADRVQFQLLVDVPGDGHRELVQLWHCAAPVMILRLSSPCFFTGRINPFSRTSFWRGRNKPSGEPFALTASHQVRERAVSVR